MFVGGVVVCWLPGVICRRAGQDEGGRGAHRRVIIKTTTKNDIRRSSFSCHVTVSDMAPGFHIRKDNGGRGSLLTWAGLTCHVGAVRRL
jgi:hypothetical protein